MILNLEKKSETNEIQKFGTNQIKNNMQFRKNFADRYVELSMIKDQETDPVKKEKMRSRLALGILDFSDL